MNDWPAINLLPDPRRFSRARRRRIARWGTACAAYAGLTLAAWGGRALLDNGGREALARQLASASADEAAMSSSLTARQRELADANAALATARALRERPDWSLLLAALGTASDPDVELREVRLVSSAPGTTNSPPRPATPAAATREAALFRGAPFALSLRGTGASQHAVSQFALRLQALGLFDEVQLMRSSRSPTATLSTAVGFEMHCTITEAGGTP